MTETDQSPAGNKISAQQAPAVSQFERREIQAPIAACLIREFASEIGLERAMNIATAAIQKDAAKAGKSMAEKSGNNSLKEMGIIVKKIWGENEAITFQILEETDWMLRFNVTHCRYAEYYKETSMLDVGYCLSCSRDESFTRGFNPNIKMTRTSTIMQGSPVCDFQFVLEEPQTSE